MKRPRKSASTPLRTGLGEDALLRRLGALGDAEVGAGGGEADAELGEALLDRLQLAVRAGGVAQPRLLLEQVGARGLESGAARPVACSSTNVCATVLAIFAALRASPACAVT